MGYYAIFSCDSDIVGKISRNLIYRVDRLIYFKLFDVDDDFQQSNENIIEHGHLMYEWLKKSFES